MERRHTPRGAQDLLLAVCSGLTPAWAQGTIWGTLTHSFFFFFLNHYFWLPLAGTIAISYYRYGNWDRRHVVTGPSFTAYYLAVLESDPLQIGFRTCSLLGGWWLLGSTWLCRRFGVWCNSQLHAWGLSWQSQGTYHVVSRIKQGSPAHTKPIVLYPWTHAKLLKWLPLGLER